MEREAEKIYKYLDEIRVLVERNVNADGTCRFDMLRIQIALDFARAELCRSISAYHFGRLEHHPPAD